MSEAASTVRRKLLAPIARVDAPEVCQQQLKVSSSTFGEDEEKRTEVGDGCDRAVAVSFTEDDVLELFVGFVRGMLPT